MTQNYQNSGQKFDLEERTQKFASDVRCFIKKLPQQLYISSDYDQLWRSSGSVGANYIEANESFSTGDYKYRVGICRKEAKEAKYWFELIKQFLPEEMKQEQCRLAQEAHEL